MQKNNLLLTGGHAATTAISVIKELQKKYPDYNLYWVGPKSAVEGKYVPTLASRVMEKMQVKFISITTGRLQRKFTVWTIPSLLKIPVGIFQAFKIISDIKPRIVISFGGFASVPVCFVGWIFRIPVIIHEQTVAAGLANKITAFFARKVLIARIDSQEFFTKSKTILVGNPVNAEIVKIEPKLKLSAKPVIYITGGSSGAQRINSVVGEALFDLLKNYKIIHQTGKLDYEVFKEKRENFPSDLKKNYEVYDFIDPNEMPEIFGRADVIVSRAGANTLSEIAITKRPAILIPIPWTAYDEQTKNAKLLEKSGIAVILEEKDLNAESLLKNIKNVVKNWDRMVKNSDNSLGDLDRSAASKFVDEVEELLE